MPNFTVKELADKVREVAAENPGYMYSNPLLRDIPAPSCRYSHGTEPGCIVGVALFRLGVPIEKLQQFDSGADDDNGTKVGGTATAVIRQMWGDDAANSAEAMWVRDVQQGQDLRKSWGNAVKDADHYATI